MERIGMASYERVAETVREEIRNGSLRPGDKLPGNRQVAELHNVSLGTAQRALRALQDEGWLATTPAVGVFVNGIPNDDEDLQPDLAKMAGELVSLRTAVTELTNRVTNLEQGTTQ
ncbi:GntR family transcriptional regulator [Tamaricihabitans halophyticus]|uniref:GntR family transcriptional regulator n=1 Tax=Tamaricihabitans halophyticus TaxID=1262583 RepID=UPI001FB33A86|nr:winged helix-turn-helix domain-containing protein [Tamaricihabitans halophyticus]